jgi:hypothetical protein
MKFLKWPDDIFPVASTALTAFFIFAILSGWAHDHPLVWITVPAFLSAATAAGIGYLACCKRKKEI